MRRPMEGARRKVSKDGFNTSIIDLPVRARQRDGLIGLTPELSPGELVIATISQLEREAHLRRLAGTPDRYFSDLARWLRAGGRHHPIRWEATA